MTVNIWLALCSDRHVHYRTAHRWFDTVGLAEAGFCRLTQSKYPAVANWTDAYLASLAIDRGMTN